MVEENCRSPRLRSSVGQCAAGKSELQSIVGSIEPCLLRAEAKSAAAAAEGLPTQLRVTDLVICWVEQSAKGQHSAG